MKITGIENRESKQRKWIFKTSIFYLILKKTQAMLTLQQRKERDTFILWSS